MAGLGDIFGKGSIAEQIFVWGVLNQVVGALGQPYFTELTQLVNSHNPDMVLDPTQVAQLVVRGKYGTAEAKAEAAKSGIDGSRFDYLVDLATAYLDPADLAQLVVRNFMPLEDATVEASLTGLDADRFARLVSIAGDAPAPGDLATALRRGLVPEEGPADGVSFAQGIREGRLADKYVDMIKALAVQWPTPDDALNALLEGQISPDDGKALYEKFGGDPQYFQMLYDTRGNAPSPLEAIEMVKRGVIPKDGTGPDVVSYEQAFLEGPWRNKWSAPYYALADYLPPPRTVTAMLKSGGLTTDQAASLLTKQGLTPDLVQAYINDALQTATPTEKELTLTSILDLYQAHIISKTDTASMVQSLGYSAENTDQLIAWRDLQRAIAAVNSAVTRIQTLYIGYKITRETAVSTLNALAVPADQVSELLQVWDLEAAANIKQLTEAQIVDSWAIGAQDQAEAVSELQAIGYTAFDAWRLLSIKAKAPLPDKPAAGPNPVGPIP
ncbi:MAG: hypothetical protein ACREHG_04960 [Candidatus Saccharimonadales bacterium]